MIAWYLFVLKKVKEMQMGKVRREEEEEDDDNDELVENYIANIMGERSVI